jgi:hypothetical protein
MSNSDVVPGDVTEFILKHIDSVAAMEALLLVRSRSDHDWGIDELAKRLYITEDQTMAVLSSLCNSELVVELEGSPMRYRFQLASKNLEQLVTRVAEVYAKHLVPVTNLIHSKPASRVQQFADAFKFRRED